MIVETGGVSLDSTQQTVLYFGLRTSPLEWRAELAAAEAAGYVPVVAAPTDLGWTGLPAGQRMEEPEAGRGTALADAAVARLGADRSPVAVVAWSDPFVRAAGHAAAALGLRGPGAAALTCTDKAAQRAALEGSGLNPGWRRGGTRRQLRDAAAELGLPLVFKPAHASGGRGVVLLREEGDLDAAPAGTARNYTGSDAFVVERYVAGSEHSVAGFVVGGEPVVHAVADKHLDGAGIMPVTTTVVPSALSGPRVERLRAAAVAAVRAVGIEYGGFHVDLRLSAEGPKVLEVGARLGGDLINSHLVPLADGNRFAPYRELLRVLGGDDAAPTPPEFTSAAAMLTVPVGDRGTAELVGLARGHPAVRLADGWPSDGPPLVAAVVTAPSSGGLRAVADDVRAWVGG